MTMRDRFVPPNKLAYGPLALLDWLCRAGPDGRMVMTHSTMSGSLSELLEVDPSAKHGLKRTFPFSDPAALDMLGGRDVTDLRTLGGYALDRFQRSEFEPASSRGADGIPPERLRAVMERHGKDAFDYTANVYLPSARTMELWQGGVRDEAERRRASRAERELASHRLVLIKAPWSARRRLPEEIASRLPDRFVFPVSTRSVIRPYAVGEVRRETGGRLYLSKVEHLPADGGAFGTDPVIGKDPNVYVDKADVMVDGISREDVRRLTEAYAEDARARDAADVRLLEKLAGPLSEWTSAQAQRDAERDDAVAAILGGSGTGPRP